MYSMADISGAASPPSSPFPADTDAPKTISDRIDPTMSVFLATLEAFKVYRSYEEHENNLLNQRVTWLITVQTVLIAALAYLVQKQYEIVERVVASDKPFLDMAFAVLSGRFGIVLYLIAIVGGVFAGFALVGVVAAAEAQRRVRDQWKTRYVEAGENSVAGTFLPRLAGGGSEVAARLGRVFGYGLPCLFILLWLVVLAWLCFEPDLGVGTLLPRIHGYF
jgi:hypothetical protein